MWSKKERVTQQQTTQTQPCKPASKNRLRTWIEVVARLMSFGFTIAAMLTPETPEGDAYQTFALVFAVLDDLRSALQALV